MLYVADEYGVDVDIINYGIIVPKKVCYLPEPDQLLIRTFLSSPIITDNFANHNLRRIFCNYLSQSDRDAYEFYQSNALRMNSIYLLSSIRRPSIKKALEELITPEIVNPNQNSPTHEKSIYDNKSPMQKVEFVNKIKQFLVQNIDIGLRDILRWFFSSF